MTGFNVTGQGKDAAVELTFEKTAGAGFCLDVPGASQQAGISMQLYTCNSTAAQAWAIIGPVA